MILSVQGERLGAFLEWVGMGLVQQGRLGQFTASGCINVQLLIRGYCQQMYKKTTKQLFY